MSAHAGMDTARYPGTTTMQWLWDNTNLAWTRLYLPVKGPGLQDKLTWVGTCPVLRGMGWGVAPIYVGKQRNSTTLKAHRGAEEFNGYLDGVEATALPASQALKESRSDDLGIPASPARSSPDWRLN